jgi:hypothetical protein
MMMVAMVPAVVIATVGTIPIVGVPRIIAIAIGVVRAMVEDIVVRRCVPITVVRMVCGISVATASHVVIGPAPTIPLSRGRRGRCKC